MAGTADDLRFLDEACALATMAASDRGGPFGAIVVRQGEVVATGTNRVTFDHDPTAHAEVVALRAAGTALGTNVLSGCTLYASCQPCPMCMAAAWWSRVDRIVFAATAADAAAVGFDDAELWTAIQDPEVAPVEPEHIAIDSALDPFRAWTANANRIEY